MRKKSLITRLMEDSEGIDLEIAPEIENDSGETAETPDASLTPETQETVVPFGLDPALINLYFETGIKLITDIPKQCNAIPVVVDFAERRITLFFPSSRREEEFTFDEVTDLLSRLGGGEKAVKTEKPAVIEDEETAPTQNSSVPATQTPTAGNPDLSKEQQAANDELAAAMAKASNLLQTPDEKLAAISQETGVDLLSAKKDAAGIIKKNNQDTINSLKTATQKIADINKSAGGSATPGV